MGQLILIESMMLVVCLVVSYIYQEPNQLPFILPLVITTVIGGVLCLLGIKHKGGINMREAYLVVGMTWIVFSIFGTIPFMLDGKCPDLASGFFESMSGFTTTGASVMPDVSGLPHSILFWRSLSHWVGGLGIVFFTMTLLPVSGHGETRLFAAESTGLAQEKLHSKIKTTAAWIWSIYLSLTLSCAVALWIGGMPIFDSVNHAMSTISTGGFVTHSEGIPFFHSKVIEYILIVFMFLGGMNFYILYTAATKRTLSPFRNNSELKFYAILVLGIAAIVAVSEIIHNHYGLEESIRKALFNCIAINSTTGFSNDDYQSWYAPTNVLIMFLMFAGGSSGSTSAGFKSIRMLILLKTTNLQFKRIFHPSAVLPVKINKKPIRPETEQNVMALLFWFVFVIVIGTAALLCTGLTPYDSLNISLSSVCNIGTNLGHKFGPTEGLVGIPESAKWICSVLMLVGRLEILAILVPFTRSFWKRK